MALNWRQTYLFLLITSLLPNTKLCEEWQDIKDPGPVIFDISNVLRKIIWDNLEVTKNSTVEHRRGHQLLEWEGHLPISLSEEENLDSFRFPQLSPIVACTRISLVQSRIEQWRNVTLEQIINAVNIPQRRTNVPVTYLLKENDASSILRSWNMSMSTLPNAKFWGAIMHLTKQQVFTINLNLLDYWINDPKFKQSLSIEQTGIMYDDQTKNVLWLKELLKVSNICAYLVETYSDQFVPSYSAFMETMNSIHETNEQYIRRINPNCRIQYRMKWIPNKEHQELIDLRHYLLFIQFSLKWLRSSKQNVILDTFIPNTDQRASQNVFEDVEQVMDQILPKAKEVILPEILYKFQVFQILRQLDAFIHPNFILKMLEKAGEHFDHLYFPSDLEFIGEILPKLETQMECFDQSNSSKQLAWKKHFQERDAKLGNISHNFLIGNILHIITSYGPERTLVTIALHESRLPEADVIDKLRQQNFSLGCYMVASSFPESFKTKQFIGNRCLELASTFIIEVKDGFTGSSYRNAITLKAVLARMRKFINLREQISRVYPNKTLIIKWNENIWLPGFFSQYSLFCTEVQSQNNKITEVIINLARIHNLKILLKTIISSPVYELGWFNFLKTRDELRNYSMTCPIFASRGSFIQTLDKDWKQDPCITFEELPVERVDFGEVQGASVAFSCEIETRLSKEATMLMYQIMFRRFTTVEFHRLDDGLPCRKSALHMVEADWSKIFVENRTFLIEIHAESDDLNYWIKYFDQVPFSYKGIHFYGWENMENVFEIPKIPVNLGLTIQNCTRELLQSFKAIKEVKVGIKYFVCVEERVPRFPYWMSELSDFLEDHLYLKTTIQMAFPSTTVYFRMKIGIKEEETLNERERAEMFLRLVGDLTRFGNAYGIRYLFQAFEGIYDDHGAPGWWKILDSEDLANSSVYIEMESEYFERPTWTPRLEENSNEGRSAENSDAILGDDIMLKIVGMVGLGLVGLLIAVILIAIALYWKLRKRILSKEAEDQFRLGAMGDQEGVLEYLKVKYDKDKFEIPLRKIMLGAVIGTGNFGVVHKAAIDNKSYAVKLTKDNTSVHSIKSLLMEVKLLIYVGDHENVIKFEGAYTKEIGYGMIYMVLELCEKGSLDKHLKTLKSSGEEEVDIYELYRFCQEIANGMDFISGRNVVHSDLATRNVLLDSNLTCKIGDLGLSRKLNEMGEYVKESDDELPWRWMSIESLKEKIFTVKSDVWSYGVTVWEIFTLANMPYEKEFPIWNSSFIQEIENGLRLTMSRPVSASPETYKVIKSCWELEPENRPDFRFLIKHFISLRSVLYDDIK